MARRSHTSLATEAPDDASPGLTPRLRFPEYHDLPPWATIPLDKIAQRVSDRNDGGNLTRVLTNSAEHGVLDQQDYFDREIVTTSKLDGYCIVDKGDFVYNPRKSTIAPVGPISRNNVGTGVMSPLYTVFRFSHVDTDFYEHYFRSTAWHGYLRSASSTGARHDRMAITPGVFMRMPVPVPDPAEQQKIADCLTSLDELIAAQGQKVEALKAHKKGLMQHLFPQEGQTLPRLRFPEFRDAPKWEKATIGDLGPFITSGSRGWAEFYADSGDLFIRITNLTRESVGLDLRNRKYVNLPSNLTEMARTGVRPGDVLISVTADIGIVGYVGECVPIPAYINQHIALVRFDQSSVCSEFVALWLSSDGAQRRFRAGTDQGTKAGMNLDQVRRIPLSLPDLDEQQRIADCLTSLDAAIAAESDALAALKTHKKGLMQGLFPTPADEAADGASRE